MERKRRGVFAAFRKKGFDMISLEAVFREDKDLVQEYFHIQNRFAVQVICVISLVINLFWLLTYFSKGLSGFFTLGHMATLFMVVFPAFILIYTSRESKSSDKAFRYVQLLLHLCIVTSVIMLEISRGFDFAATHPGDDFNQVSLSCYWLIACAFIPMITTADSIAVVVMLMLPAIIPQFICPRGSYNFTSNMIICLSIVMAYFAFRSLSLKSASLINKLSETSYVDFQTKALNRRALSEYFDDIKTSKVSNIGVMVMDIDDLKEYNDSQSYAKGDDAIRQISNAVMKLGFTNEMVFRHGGGEFVITTADTDEENLVRNALKVKDTIEALEISRDDGTPRKTITVTVGCTLVAKEDLNGLEPITEAETQLSIGKKGAKNCVVMKGKIFVAEGEITLSQKPSPYTDRVSQAVNEAIRKREIKPYFQPLYETASGKLVGAEALARWVKEDGTTILPSEFIPELEKNSSILALDWFIYEECCKTLRKQMELGIPQVRISVNFSRMHALYERNLENRLCEIADANGVPHSLIEIEITESAYIHLPNIIEPFVKGIRSKGFAIAVDDFGTGASSLEFLKTVDVDTLKIDKSLISSDCSDQKERVLLESVVFLAHRLQLNSVAEGVETLEQLGFLKALGCNQIQGFIFAKPMPEDEFIEKCKVEASTEPLETLVMNHIQSPSMKILLDTVFKQYPIVLMGNLTRNSYYTMTYESFTSHSYSRVGTITDLLDEIASTLCESQIDEFRKTFDLENQIAAYKRGENKIVFSGKIHGDNAEDKDSYKNMDTTTYFIKENGNDDIQVITLCSESIN